MLETRILVIGDVSLECGVAIEPAERTPETPDHAIRLGKPQHQDGHFIRLPGGAWRIAEYLNSKEQDAARPINVVAVPQTVRDFTHIPDDNCAPLQFVRMELFATAMNWIKEAKRWLPNGTAKTYRISTTLARRRANDAFFLAIAEELGSREVKEFLNTCSVLVICDRQLGFRRAISKTLLKKDFAAALDLLRPSHGDAGHSQSHPAPWVVLETTDPLDNDQAALLKTLEASKLLDRTVVVLSANSLKASGIVLRDDLSLEKSVEDLTKAIENACLKASNVPENETALDSIRKIKCFVIRLGSRAALLWRPEKSAGDKGRVQLIYGSNPYEPQASPAAESSDLGTMHGYSSIVAAEIAIGLSNSDLSGGDPDTAFWDQLVSSCALGLAACGRYFDAGLGRLPADIPKVFERLWQQKGDKHDVKSQPFQLIDGAEASVYPQDWTIHQAKQRSSITVAAGGKSASKPDPHVNGPPDAAVEVVRKGLCVLREYGIPYVEHVDLATADRHEIENYAGIASLITKYMDDVKWVRPLCLGVFGPPGCGKSFGIEQVVQAITGYKPSISVSRMTFNLSQFNSSGQLARAFHKIRNDGLAGNLPLVFVDEFDSGFEGRDYGWLKYLLAPMQDGKFLDGDELFHLPRCILVFIGGQNRDFIEFESRLRDEKFIAAKGRDFISRLRHYLVVKGPDLPGPGDERSGEDRALWPGRRLRRAMVLRSVLERSLPIVIETEKGEAGEIIKRANIDQKVIEAFLGVECYKHGVRSLEAIVDMSRASVTRRSFQKSSLPPEEQLELHVDARRFLEIANGVKSPAIDPSR